MVAQRVTIYVENSALNRPFDDRSQERIDAEAKAIETVLEWVRTGTVAMMTSGAVRFENAQSPDRVRRERVDEWIALAEREQLTDLVVEGRAKELRATGLGAMDALHAAAAEASGADYLLSCDDHLLRRYNGPVRAMNPIDFVRRIAGTEQQP